MNSSKSNKQVKTTPKNPLQKSRNLDPRSRMNHFFMLLKQNIRNRVAKKYNRNRKNMGFEVTCFSNLYEFESIGKRGLDRQKRNIEILKET